MIMITSRYTHLVPLVALASEERSGKYAAEKRAVKFTKSSLT